MNHNKFGLIYRKFGVIFLYFSNLRFLYLFFLFIVFCHYLSLVMFRFVMLCV